MTDRIAALEALAAELEAAPCGSRAMSDECLLAWGWTFFETEFYQRKTNRWVSPDNHEIAEERRPDPTRSCDDCAAAMPEGAFVDAINEDGRTGKQWFVSLHERKSNRRLADAFGATLPLAWSAAICRALAAEEEAKEKGND